MKKKIVAMMLVISMILSMCACRQDVTGTTEAPEQTTSAPEQSTAGTDEAETSSAAGEESLYPIVEEPIVLKGIVQGGTTSDYDEQGRKIWDLVAEITGITIEWEKVDKKNINTRLAGGDWPDIFLGDFSAEIVNDYGVTGGRFLNVADYLEYMPNLEKTYEDYPELKKATTELNGEIYRLGKVGVASTGTIVRPHVNMEVLRNAGVTEKPDTIDEFYQALVALKEKNGGAGFIPRLGSKRSSSYWAPMLFAAFGTLVDMDWEADDNGKIVYSNATEQMRRYWTFMNKLYEEGLIHQESATLDTLVRNDLEMTSKKIAFLDGASGSLNAEHFDSGKLEMEVCIPFTSEYDDTRTIVLQNVVSVGGYLVNAETKYAVEICKMLDIAYAYEEVVEGTGLHGMAFCYGPEGVTWVKHDDGKTYEFINTPEGYASGAAYANAEWVWGTWGGRQDQMAGLVPNTPGDNSTVRQESYIADVFPYATKYQFPAKMLKFTDDETYVIGNKLTDIDTYCKEMEVKFITGLVDIETGWDTYIDNLNKMGLSEVLEVYQAAYDRWEGK